jgi:hypothetical protein
MIRKGLFQSNATCTEQDRELEARINEGLARAGRGRVALYTEERDGGQKFGMVFYIGTRSKTVTRDHFELDIEDVVRGLSSIAQNAALPIGWSYDVEDADFLDTESYTDAILPE